MAGLPGRSGSSNCRPSRPGPSRNLSGAALAESIHTEKRWAATPVGDRGTEGQSRSAGHGHHPQPDLRGGLLGFSYGFRPGRGQHEALDALATAIQQREVNYILDADTRGFFDNLSKPRLLQFVEHRVADGRILRLIRKWLNAGVMEDGILSSMEASIPQGSVATPLTQKQTFSLDGR